MTFMLSGRGCGGVKTDSLYHVVSLSPAGIPVHKFLICPIWEIDMGLLGLSSQGVTILPRYGENGQQVIINNALVYDVFDLVGKMYYPYASDFFFEVANMGFSRKIPKNAAGLDKLSIYSVHYMIHQKAALYFSPTGYEQYLWQNVMPASFPCLAMIQEHNHPNALPGQTCTQLWAYMIDPSDITGGTRQFVSATYPVAYQSRSLEFQFGAFMWMPVNNFVATTTRDGELSDAMKATLSKLSPQMKVTTLNVKDVELEDESEE